MSVDPGRLLRDVIDRSAHEHKAVAYEIGYQPDYFSRVLDGERGVNLDRLGKLPIDVQRAWLEMWAERIGAHTESRDGGDMQALAALLASRRVRLTIEAR